jgi:nitrogen regulatory protein PII
MLALSIVIRPQKADLLCQRLLASGLVAELTAAECRGYGRQKGQLEQYQGTEYHIDFLPKVLITGLIAREAADQVIELVCATARTGRIGDGKIFLVPVEQTLGDTAPD